jgi:hypothetical protein
LNIPLSRSSTSPTIFALASVESSIEYSLLLTKEGKEMKKKILLWISLFIGGYIYGNGGAPKGMEMIMFVSFAALWGIGLGVWITRAGYKVKRWKDKVFSVAGYEVRVTRPGEIEPEPVVKLVKNKQKKQECDLCEGETEIRIAGTKEKMDCPKCKGKAAAGG